MFTATTSITLSDEQLSRFTGYPVVLPVFEGPLDLLLYLIRRQEIDVYDIPIARVTAQFIDYLALLEVLDVEVAADFLVMAATLMEIKSRLLLPRPPVFLEEEDEEEDPRAELVRHLLEYQQYKSAAGELQQRAVEQQRLFARPDVVQNLAFARPEPLMDGNPDAFSLWAALQEVLARVEAAGPQVREVTRPKISIRQQMLLILKLLAASPHGVAFQQFFFLESDSHLPTRNEVIVTFLAMLELIRMRRIYVTQQELFGEITVHLVGQAELVMPA